VFDLFFYASGEQSSHINPAGGARQVNS